MTDRTCKQCHAAKIRVALSAVATALPPPGQNCPDCSGRGYTEDGFCVCPAGRTYIDRLDDHVAKALDVLHDAQYPDQAASA